LKDAVAAIQILETNAHLLILARREDHLETEAMQERMAKEKRAWEQCCEEKEAAQLITGRIDVKRQKLIAEVKVLENKLKHSEGLVAELVKKEPKRRCTRRDERERSDSVEEC
jgi:uncharacterized protein YbaP (TraB family)